MDEWPKLDCVYLFIFLGGGLKIDYFLISYLIFFYRFLGEKWPRHVLYKCYPGILNIGLTFTL